MALSPLQRREERFQPITISPAPTKTYAFNFRNGELEDRLIDGEEALRQFILKTILTARYRFLIYDNQYGCELDGLLGQDISYELMRSEITRMIREALIYDDRIIDVGNFQIQRESDKLFVTFTVSGKDYTLELEQEVSIDRV